MVKTVLLALVAIVIIVAGCEYTTPAPEVEITYVTPVAGVLSQADSSLEIDEIDFVVYNYVEALITELEIEYFDSKGESAIAPPLPPVQMHFVLLAEGVNKLEVIPIPLTQELVNYIFSVNDYASAKLTFRGEDNYGHEKTFDVDMNWGIQGLD